MVRRAVLPFVLAVATGCGLPPLRGVDLAHGGADARPSAARDAGPDATSPPPDGRQPEGQPDAAPEAPSPDTAAPPCTATSCPSSEYCDSGTRLCTPRFGRGALSGYTKDACTGATIEVKLGFANRHLCSFSGKGSFTFLDVPTGVKLTLVGAADGYDRFTRPIVVEAGGTAELAVAMTPVGGCQAPPPPPPRCRCIETGCQPN